MTEIDKDELEKTLRVFQKEFYNLKDENDNLIFPVFNTLPSKKDYPDYYEVIKRPVSLNTLKKRVPHYTDPQPFLTDIVQIAWNARVYNSPDSIIYSYARKFDENIRENVAPKLIKKYPHVIYPNLGPLPEAEDNKLQEKMLEKYGTSKVEPPKRKIVIKPFHMDGMKGEPEQTRTRSRLRIINKKEEPKETALENKTTQQSQQVTTTTTTTTTPSKSEDKITQKDQNVTLPPRKASLLQQQQQLVQNHSKKGITEPVISMGQNNNVPPTTQGYTLPQMQTSFHVNTQTQLPTFNQPLSFTPLDIPSVQDTFNNLHSNINRKAYSPDISHSGTPNSMSRSVQPKAHIKRGRPPVIDLPYVQRIKNILKNLKRERDATNKKWLTAPFERFPVEYEYSDVHKKLPEAVGLNDIRKKSKWRKYKSFQSFQDDVTLMLAAFKLFYSNDNIMLASIAQFHATFTKMARAELAKPDRSYLPEGEVRVPLDEVTVNNAQYHIGDWALIRNPNDESKPTVGQIFRIWSMPDGTKWFNACWYFRPEQTVHRVDRLFYKHEVMKTGQYRDNLVNDLVGKCYVVHFTRYQRGDPDLKIDGPMFICEFRYNEADKVFNKIRTWKACLPEELRDQDEPTVPVGSRKFFKYPSPIRQLLPPNATPNDPIPEPVEGAADAPPLVGAVYLRPPLKRDDLGEYASSPDSPKHIIRPGEPYGEGKIDFEMGTLTLSTSAIRKVSYYQAKKAQAALNADMNAGKIPAQVHTGFDAESSNNTNLQLNDSITLQKLKERQLQKLQEQQEQQRQQQMKNRSTNHNFTALVNNMAPHAARNALTTVMTNTPSAFTLPISITKNVETLQHSYNSDTRRINDVTLPHKRHRGELLWFKGPSVGIEERFLNSANRDIYEFKLNDMSTGTKRSRLDYKEVEEEVVEHARATRHNKKKDFFEDDAEFKMPEEGIEEVGNKNIAGTYLLGLRPSASFIAHKLTENESHS